MNDAANPEAQQVAGNQPLNADRIKLRTHGHELLDQTLAAEACVSHRNLGNHYVAAADGPVNLGDQLLATHTAVGPAGVAVRKERRADPTDGLALQHFDPLRR